MPLQDVHDAANEFFDSLHAISDAEIIAGEKLSNLISAAASYGLPLVETAEIGIDSPNVEALKLPKLPPLGDIVKLAGQLQKLLAALQAAFPQGK